MHRTTLQYDSVREIERDLDVYCMHCATKTVHTKSDRRKTTIKLLLFTFCFEFSFVIFSSEVRARSVHLPGLRSIAHVLAFGQIGAFFAHFGCVSKSMVWYFCYILHRALDTRRSRWTIFIKIFFFNSAATIRTKVPVSLSRDTQFYSPSKTHFTVQCFHALHFSMHWFSLLCHFSVLNIKIPFGCSGLYIFSAAVVYILLANINEKARAHKTTIQNPIVTHCHAQLRERVYNNK